MKGICQHHYWIPSWECKMHTSGEMALHTQFVLNHLEYLLHQVPSPQLHLQKSLRARGSTLWVVWWRLDIVLLHQWKDSVGNCYTVSVCKAHSKMQSMSLLGMVWRYAPQENFEKLDTQICKIRVFYCKNWLLYAYYGCKDMNTMHCHIMH